MNNIKNITALIFILLLVSGIVFVSIKASSQGARLVEIEKEIQMLEEQNKKLKNKMITETSLQYLSKVAGAIEFSDPSKIIYLGPVASSLNSSLAYADKNQNR